MAIDWQKYVGQLVDLGSESYERKQTRMILKAGMIVLFLIVVWRFLK
jgi:hypothetical protein